MTSRGRAKRNHRRWPRPEWLVWDRRRLRRALLAMGCGVSLAAALWYGVPRTLHALRAHPYFAVTAIHVDGNRRLSVGEILQWGGIDETSSIWDAAPRLVELRLQAHPWIARANVRREFPHRLLISVEERRPVAIARLDEWNYVDVAGRILGPLQSDDSRDFPLITGFEDTATRSFAGLGVHRAVRFLRLCERLRCVEAVSEIHVDEHQGITVFPVRTAVAVVVGWGSWREKLTRSARVFAAWQGQVGRLAAVDVSFRDLVVVKLREERHPPTGRAAQKGVRV